MANSDRTISLTKKSKAIAAYQNPLRLDPNFEISHHNLGLALQANSFTNIDNSCLIKI
ncbi:tetratricopeptide repeat protein [Nostoc sp. KVJ20]|uniref:tetratricopeptide repeat protein n=1 Tax=Nostoc sp. KVJ20 TaxID=457944 RepID=UPI000ABF4C42|nr:tetratricopeptide repeat protein [Nostoc sp. KVJ20]